MTGQAVDMRAVAEALGFEPDNHHNALLCPYCGDLARTGIEDLFRLSVRTSAEEAIGIRPLPTPGDSE